MEAAVATALKIAAALVVGVPLIVYLAQDGLIFLRQPMPEARRAEIARTIPQAESVFLSAADGTRVHAWHLKAGPTLVLYFGGNAEEVSWMLEVARAETPGVSWLLLDYRGYGLSEGSPSQKALVADALALYDRATTLPGVDAKRILAFGRSLGSGVAVQLAAQRPVAGVILVAPFDSLVEVGKRVYPFLPVDWMLKHRFDSAALAPKMKTPLLCIVASHDEIIPAEHAKRLYDAWGGPKQWIGLEGAGHNSTDNAANYWPSITRFLTEKPS